MNNNENRFSIDTLTNVENLSDTCSTETIKVSEINKKQNILTKISKISGYIVISLIIILLVLVITGWLGYIVKIF